jgi:hypothetical protein
MLTIAARILSVIALILSFHLIAGCDSGGSSGPNGPDPTGDLTFSSCEVVEINNQMHVRWTANRATRGDFRYGQGTLAQITSEPSYETEHDVLLIGLSFDAQYMYRLTATDQQGNTADCEGNFNTPVKATPEPIITNFAVTGVTESQAILSWITDELATTILYYGKGAFTDSIVISGFDFEHEVTLTDLEYITNYSVRPEAIDLDGLRGVGMWFDDLSIAVGETSEVAIHLDGASDLAALQYKLQFEDTLNIHSANGAVSILDLRSGPFTSSEMSPLFFQDIRNSERYVTNEMAWTIIYDGNDRVGTTADGGGVVAILQVRGLKAGELPSAFDETDSFGLDMFAVQRTCSLRTGTITVTP